jgi:hypothetical protein
MGLGKSRHSRHGVPKMVKELKEVVGPGTVVELFEWNEYDKILQRIKGYQPKYLKPFGHSYGGSTINFLCEALQSMPIRILHAVFCDIVWRPEIYKIEADSRHADKQVIVSGNIEKLSTVEQDRTWLTGHDCVTGPNTEYVRREVAEGKWWNITSRHGFLDRHPLFREMVFEAVLGS